MTAPFKAASVAVAKPFTTTTVRPKNAGVDDRLKPSAELQILVGGPYTRDEEEHRYGHTALRVRVSGVDVTYDFGRYGETRGMFDETGDGILRVWTDFSSYIRGENALGRVTTGFAYPIFDHQAQAVTAYFDRLIAAGTTLPRQGRTGMKAYKLATDYHALAPNCTTLSLDGAKQAIPAIDAGSEKFNKPEDVLTRTERLALAAKGGAKRLFLPANLETFLSAGASVKAVRIDRHGGRK